MEADMDVREAVVVSAWAVVQEADSYVRLSADNNYVSRDALGEAVENHRAALRALGLSVLREEARIPVSAEAQKEK